MPRRVVPCVAFLAAVVALGACAGKESATKSDGTGGQSAIGGSAGSASPNGGFAGGGAGSGAGSGGANTGGMGGDGGGGAGAGRAGSAAGGDVVCPEVPIPLRTVGVRLELETKLELGGQTIEFGEPAPLEGGGTLLPLELRFYLSEPRLVQADGSTVRVDIMTVATGEPVPYGVHLVNADDAASLHFTLLGPPGSYTGVSFTLGINDACNSLSSANPPLSAASAMTWPPPFGFLFLRYAGTVTPGMAAPTDGGVVSAPPSAIHMGGLPGSVFATRVETRGNITLEAGGPTNLNLMFDLDELFRAASSSLDVSDFMGPPGPEVQAGERVRRMAPELSLFTLVAP